MKRPAKSKGPKDGGTYLERARQRWGSALPDWVAVLARAADAEVAKGGSLTSLGKRVGVLGYRVSAVIGKTYPAGPALLRIEETVRGKLMGARVSCPALGMTIGRDQCAAFQSQRFSAASPASVRLARTCPDCPNAIGGSHDD
jgi:hypothetical protein